jgi:uncharacterized protein (TIGR03067 family)
MKEHPDLAALQGRWKVESKSYRGGSFGFPDTETVWEFRGDTWAASSKWHGYVSASASKVALDSVDGVKRLKYTSCRRLDKDGKPDGEEPDGVLWYRLDGDELTVANRVRGDKGRVVDPAKPDDDTAVMVLVRVKND